MTETYSRASREAFFQPAPISAWPAKILKPGLLPSSAPVRRNCAYLIASVSLLTEKKFIATDHPATTSKRPSASTTGPF